MGKQWQTLFCWAPKSLQMVTAAMKLKDTCSLKKKKKSYDQPRQHIEKQRYYFAGKVPSSQSYGLSSIMYGCESWTIKKVEHWRIDAFELWCWRRLLRVPWTARRSNHSILKKSVLNIHWKDWCWSWNSILWPLMWRTDSFEKTLMLGKIEGWKRRQQQRMRWLDGITDSMDEFE